MVQVAILDRAEPIAYRIGSFELRPREQQLLVEDGTAVRLGSRAFALLVVLAESGGELVTRDEILDRVWPNHVVEDNNLAVQVLALRRVLGKDSIVTIPGRGYRLALPVERLLRASPLASAASGAAPHPTGILGSMPVGTSPLIGREADLEELARAMASNHVVVIVGPTGIGKTSLATAIAQRHAQKRDRGVAILDLTFLNGAAEIALQLVHVLGVPCGIEDDPLAVARSALAGSEMLIVLDNAEHIIEPVANLVASLLRSCHLLRFLVTSQCRPHLQCARLFHIEPLSVPPDGSTLDEAMNHGAVAFFRDQAMAVDRRFVLHKGNLAQVIELCRRLDGMPLAIKLVVARLPTFGLTELCRRMTDRFEILQAAWAGAPDRQQTLRAAYDWSYGLISAPAQSVFQTLGVFVGGFDPQMALAMFEATHKHVHGSLPYDLLEELIDHSLVMVEPSDPPRYRLLESARSYALIELSRSGREHVARVAHARAVLRRFRETGEAMWTQPHDTWLGAYEADLDNVRGVLDWCLANDRPLGFSALVVSANAFFRMGLFQEQRQRMLAYELLLPSARGPNSDAAMYCLERARVEYTVDVGLAQRWLKHAYVQGYAESDDRILYLLLGTLVTSGPDDDRSDEMLQQMGRLEQPGWPARLRRFGRVVIASRLAACGRHEEAARHQEAALEIDRRIGAADLVARDLANLCGSYLSLRDYDKADCAAREVLAWSNDRFDVDVLTAMAASVFAELMRDRLEDARTVLRQFVARSQRLGWVCMNSHLNILALFAAEDGRPLDAAMLYRQSLIKVPPDNGIDFRGDLRARLSTHFDTTHIAAQEPDIDGVPHVDSEEIARRALGESPASWRGSPRESTSPADRRI